MNVVGIITEHNPFHNGHRYHVTKAREACAADCVVSVMSGHFLQRGEPALFNKWARARMAIDGGADIIIELPAAFSVRSARSFARGSVALLEATGVVTHLCFGSETGSVEPLWPAARLLASETPEFKSLIQTKLDRGLSYPAARSKALSECLKPSDQAGRDEELFASPNNILGIEYLISVLALNSKIEPVAIKRWAAGYHDSRISLPEGIASATSIRDELQTAGKLTDNVAKVVPPSTFRLMCEETAAGRGPVFLNSCGKILFYLLRTTPASVIAEILDVTEGLENRILEASCTADTVKGLVEAVKTKRYTWTRLQRIIACILLGYSKSIAAGFDRTGPRYIRVLGISEKGRVLLKKIKKNSSLPVIMRTAPYLRQHDSLAEMLAFDVRATDIYTLLYPSTAAQCGLDYKVMPYAAGRLP